MLRNARFWLNFTIIGLTLAVGAFVGGAYSRSLNAWDWPEGWETLKAVFWNLGGLKSFGGLLAGLVILTIIIGTFVWIARHNFENENGLLLTVVIVGAAVVLFLGWLFSKWISLPSGAGMAVIGSLAVWLTLTRMSVQKNK